MRHRESTRHLLVVADLIAQHAPRQSLAPLTRHRMLDAAWRAQLRSLRRQRIALAVLGATVSLLFMFIPLAALSYLGRFGWPALGETADSRLQSALTADLKLLRQPDDVEWRLVELLEARRRSFWN